MENRTQSAVPILSKKTKISNAGDAEEMGYIWVVCHLAFFFLQVKLICLNQFEWSKKATRGMENFFQLQHKLQGSKGLRKKKSNILR